MTDTTNHAEVVRNFIETSDPLGNSEDSALAALDALTRGLEASQALSDRLKLEAQIQAGEARAHISIVQECYQIATGATGEPATWNGAEPIRKAFAAQSARIAKLEEAGRAARKELAAWVKDHGHDIATDEALALLDAALAPKEAQG